MNFVAGVIATIVSYAMWLMEGHCGRSYNMCWVSGRVIANVTDGIATWDGMFLIMADVIAIVADRLATQDELLFHFILSSATNQSVIMWCPLSTVFKDNQKDTPTPIHLRVGFCSV